MVWVTGQVCTPAATAYCGVFQHHLRLQKRNQSFKNILKWKVGFLSQFGPYIKKYIDFSGTIDRSEVFTLTESRVPVFPCVLDQPKSPRSQLSLFFRKCLYLLLLLLLLLCQLDATWSYLGKGSLSWGNAFIRLACRKVCGGILLVNYWCVRANLTVGPHTSIVNTDWTGSPDA